MPERHSDDEHGQIRRFAPVTPLLEKLGREDFSHLIDLTVNHLWVIPFPDGRVLLFDQGIGLGIACEGLVETAGFVQQLPERKARGQTAHGRNIRRSAKP